MFPMVAEVDEFTRAKAMVDAEIGRLAETDRPVPSELRLGTMIEVPSLAWSLPALLPQVDFVSIGSNDLMQFFFAADRGNPKVGDRYDPLSPAALGFLRWIQIRCAERNVPVNFCGEMAGRPLEALALLGLGYRRLSMPAAATGAVKEMVRSVDIRLLEEFLLPLLKSGVRTLRPQLAQFAETYCVPV
jgi:phosphotransferase system enzyme I (PtsP)